MSEEKQPIFSTPNKFIGVLIPEKVWQDFCEEARSVREEEEDFDCEDFAASVMVYSLCQYTESKERARKKEEKRVR